MKNFDNPKLFPPGREIRQTEKNVFDSQELNRLPRVNVNSVVLENTRLNTPKLSELENYLRTPRGCYRISVPNALNSGCISHLNKNEIN